MTRVVKGGLGSRSMNVKKNMAFTYHSILVPRALLTRGQRSATRALAKSISNWHLIGYNEGYCSNNVSFSYPEPFLRAVNGARQGALAKSISNWHLIGYNEGYCSNNVYILLPCFYGIRFWIWPEPLVAPRVRRALGTRMVSQVKHVLAV